MHAMRRSRVRAGNINPLLLLAGALLLGTLAFALAGIVEKL
jgi:hypothetical protein